MNRVEKHRTDKSRRKRMTVQAFCTCPHPYDCSRFCGIDESDLYKTLESFAQDAVNSFGGM